jgi:hypothetical protein
VHLEFDKSALILRPVCASLAPQLPKQQATVLAALRTLAEGGSAVEFAAWKHRCTTLEGMSSRTFFDAKKKLIEAGTVQETEAGRFQAV